LRHWSRTIDLAYVLNVMSGGKIRAHALRWPDLQVLLIWRRALGMGASRTRAPIMTNDDFPPETLRAMWDELRPQLRVMTPEEAEGHRLLHSLLHTQDPNDEAARTPMMITYWMGNLETAHVIGRLGENYHLEDALGRDGHWYLEHARSGLMEEDLKRTIGQHSSSSRMREMIEAQRASRGTGVSHHVKSESDEPK